MKPTFSPSGLIWVFCICIVPYISSAQTISTSQTTNWYQQKSGVFWPLMTYESAFISDQNQVLLQAPDYFAFGSIRYIVSYEGNVSYSVGIGLPSLQFGIQKNLFSLYGMPVNLKLSGGIALACLLNADGKIIVGIFNNDSTTISTDFTIGGHTTDFMDSPEERYIQYGLYLTRKIRKSFDIGLGMGVSKVFYSKWEPDPFKFNEGNIYHKNKITWQLAGTVTYFIGSK